MEHLHYVKLPEISCIITKALVYVEWSHMSYWTGQHGLLHVRAS